MASRWGVFDPRQPEVNDFRVCAHHAGVDPETVWPPAAFAALALAPRPAAEVGVFQQALSNCMLVSRADVVDAALGSIPACTSPGTSISLR